MAPIIPSPTPITGIQDSDGRALHGIRLPLEELQEKHEFAFALYTQALLAWQKDGNEKKDSDPKGGTSYFQVMGMTYLYAGVMQSHTDVDIRRNSRCPLR